MKYIRREPQAAATLERGASKEQEAAMLVGIACVKVCTIKQRRAINEIDRGVAAREIGGQQRKPIFGVANG